MSNITLELKARHFEDTDYRDNCNCTIAKSAKEHFKAKRVIEMVREVFVDGKYYSHDKYGILEFTEDAAKAAAINYSDAVIRTITLVKQ